MKGKFLTAILALTCVVGSAQGTLTSAKKLTANNPLNPLNFCADPTAVEYNGRVYVYGTNDQQQFDKNGFAKDNGYGDINSLVCMSSADLVNWTWHGVINVKEIAPWTGCSWAPSICRKTDADGNTHFYLYFANGASGIGVLKSDSPTGPWEDPLGKALIAPGQDQLGGIVWLFDPGVVVDENGVGWLSYGGGDKPNSVGNNLIDGNTRIAKLTDDMVHFTGEISVIPAPYHFEASELNIIGGKFVYTYCANWWSDRSDWDTYKYSTSYSAPGGGNMCYMVSDDPLNSDSWEYKGEYIKGPGAFGYPGGNNHTHLQQFNNSYYFFYHHAGLASAMNNGDGKGYRSIGINKITVEEDKCKISSGTMNDNGASIRNNRLVITEQHEAEELWNAAGVEYQSLKIRKVGNIIAVRAKENGSWIALRYCYSESEVKSFKAHIRGKGKMEIRIDDLNSSPVGTLEFDASSFDEYSINLDKPFKGTHTIYFVFTEVESDKYDFNYWQFSEDSDTSISSVGEDSQVVSTEYYNIAGQKCDQPTKGIYLVKRVLANGKVRTEKKIF